MAKIVLVTGGSRSGKSSFARRLAESTGGPRAFVATCPKGLDREMEQRILRHRRERSRKKWRTIEEPVNLARALAVNRKYNVMLVDCLTLWIHNLMHEAEKKRREITEDDIRKTAIRLLKVCRTRPGMVIFVTNEVGLGIVPANALARRFRDLAGRCNQVVAESADMVVLLVSGIPLTLKDERRRKD